MTASLTNNFYYLVAYTPSGSVYAKVEGSRIISVTDTPTMHRKESEVRRAQNSLVTGPHRHREFEIVKVEL